MRFAEHLGDGAYVHLSDANEIVFTANHHDPAQATDTVVLDGGAVNSLLEWVQTTRAALTHEWKGGSK